MNDERDQELVRTCLKGDQKAFETIVLEYQRPLFNAAYRIVNDRDEAEDVVQNAFVKAYENLKSYDREYKFFSWLYRIAVNEALNTLNAKRKFDTLSEEIASAEKTGDEVIQDNEDFAAIDNALRELKLEYRLVIVLNHFHGHSYSEMSYILGIPEKTVKSRLFSARNLLRDILIHNR